MRQLIEREERPQGRLIVDNANDRSVKLNGPCTLGSRMRYLREMPWINLSVVLYAFFFFFFSFFSFFFFVMLLLFCYCVWTHAYIV